jgi:hypothetical protein
MIAPLVSGGTVYHFSAASDTAVAEVYSDGRAGPSAIVSAYRRRSRAWVPESPASGWVLVMGMPATYKPSTWPAVVAVRLVTLAAARLIGAYVRLIA